MDPLPPVPDFGAAVRGGGPAVRGGGSPARTGCHPNSATMWHYTSVTLMARCQYPNPRRPRILAP